MAIRTLLLCLFTLVTLCSEAQTGPITQESLASKPLNGRVKVPRGSLYYEELGQGEPMILIHGYSLTHRMWDSQFQEFARHYRVIRYDLRGFGQSSRPIEGFQFTHAEDLVVLMDSLRITKAHIVGLSLGGEIGADMLGCFPRRVKSAVLASGNLCKTPGPSQPMGKTEAAQRDRRIASVKAMGVEALKRRWFDRLMAWCGPRREQIRVPLWNMVHEWDAWQSLHKEVRVVAGMDAYVRLKKNCPENPVLIVEGRTPGNSFSEHPEILKYLPNGKLLLLDDCGHMLNMEQPEAFNEAVLHFLGL